jgi:hypothetical protein
MRQSRRPSRPTIDLPLDRRIIDLGDGTLNVGISIRSIEPTRLMDIALVITAPYYN